MGRTPCCEKVGLNRGRWTREEDERLIKYIQQHGEGSWRSLPNNAGLQRCGKSCRLRWINYLRSDLKRGNFTAEEEETIVKLHTSMGNRWSLIASQLPGRTDNEIKNYWNSHLSRRMYSFRFIRSGPTPAVADDVASKTPSSRRRRGGRVSRSLAKKYNTASFHVASSSFRNKCNPSELHGSREEPGSTELPLGPTTAKGPDENKVPAMGPRGEGFDSEMTPGEVAGGVLLAVNAEAGVGCGSMPAGDGDGGECNATAGHGIFHDEEEWVNWILDDDDVVDAIEGYDEIWEGFNDMLLWPWDDNENNKMMIDSDNTNS
ncbi:unnamed protein product [Cuscuta europaea]|uniref:Uncharacterized protein n=1 Tax=Cuscuta europaea TaxID=41803 RepID=A0A9P1EGS6_CUSEU|nr:unnamed protein product [Cuscuta europaea]